MENLIYNELKHRGFQVDTGSVEIIEGKEKKKLEVAFVANSGNRRFYIQSALAIQDEEKMRQETKSLDNTPDSFRKIIIVNQSIEPRISDRGYLLLSLEDFLLKPDSINFA